MPPTTGVKGSDTPFHTVSICSIGLDDLTLLLKILNLKEAKQRHRDGWEIIQGDSPENGGYHDTTCSERQRHASPRLLLQQNFVCAAMPLSDHAYL